jgi:VWFA-related protein
MSRWLTLFTLTGVVVFPSARGAGQETSPPAPPEFRAGTAVVVLDVVVRDKKGRPVRDLKPEEVQVLEDDQPCTVESFRLVETEEAPEPSGGLTAPGAPTAAPSAAPEGTGVTDATRLPLNLVTLVFDRLDIEGNHLARAAARDFVKRGLSPRTEVAVFKIGQRMAVVQQYTNDPERLRQAVDVATSGADIKGDSLTRMALQASRDQLRAGGGEGAPPDVQLDGGDASETTAGRLPPGSQAVQDYGVQAKSLEVVANALRMADSLQRQMEGEWSLYPLLALVKAQERLPGRKTLLFFSQGLQVPPNLDDVFRGVISEANRANVSFYAVDARGLQARSDIHDSALALQQAAATLMQQQRKRGGEATTVEEMRVMDTVDDSLHLNLQQTLQDLSEATGGFLIANANDARQGVDRVASDIRGYYEITYVPHNPDFDGTFRKIAVKVARKDTVVQSRTGYFALPPSDRLVLPYEVPLLAALTSSEPHHDFEQQLGALHFAPGPDGVQSLVLMEVPLKSFDFDVDKRKKTFRLKLVAMAVVKDEDDRVVERFSDEFPLGGPLDRLDEVRAANAVLKRTLPLGPGHYTLEGAAAVQEGGRVSVERTEFDVPATMSGPALSSLCLVQRLEPLPKDAPPSTDPFQAGNLRIVPHLGDPVSKAASPNLSFFARIYPAGGEKAHLSLQLVREGAVIGLAEPEMPAPDEAGRIAYMGTVPAASLAPGAYEVRLTMVQGGETATAEASFELVP